MWYLHNTKDASFIFSLPVGKDLVVGRKEGDCDLYIPDDRSISRRHAIIHVVSRDKSSTVFLTDCKSKFGTFLEERKLSPGEKVTLSVGNEVKFGQGPTSGRFRVVFEPLVVCCSSMPSIEKMEAKRLVRELGGRLVSDWSSECSHLVMSSLTVTIKVVCALASCKPIVTLAWLREAVQCCHDNKPLPSPTNYQPTVVDEEVKASNTSFSPDYKRLTLFQDRVFYFFNEDQMSSLQLCLRTAGARCQLINSPSSVAMETLIVKETVVVSLKEGVGSSEEQGWAQQVNDHLISHDMRSIAESEIGFALLHISIETHCNPRSSNCRLDTSMAPPTLSQMISTQCTQSQAGPPPSFMPLQPHQPQPHTSTQSQAGPPPTPSSAASILAPNTCSQQSLPPSTRSQASIDNTQASKSSNKGRPKDQKVPETPNTKGSDKGQRSMMVDERMGAVGKFQQMIRQGSKVEDSSKVKGGARGQTFSKGATNQKITDFIRPTKSAAMHSARSASKSQAAASSDVKNEPEIKCLDSEEEFVGDSQNIVITTPKKLPGLSVKKNLALKKSSIVYSQEEAPDLHLLEASQSPNRTRVLTPQSLTRGPIERRRSGAIQSTQETSILAPNSLTPGSTQRKESGHTSPPGASFMNELFQRRKRKANEIDEPKEMESQAKKLREDQKTSEANNEILLSDSPPKLKCLDEHDNQTSQLDSDSDTEVRSKVSRGASSTQLTQGPLATSTQVTGRNTPTMKPKVSPIATTTPFISSRNRKKIKSNPEMDTSRVSPLSFSEAVDRNASMLASTQNKKDWLTPFTTLGSTRRAVAPPTSIFTTGGKRSKVNTHTEADAIWLEEGDEEEHPLGSQYEDPPPGKRYKPALSVDGFIKPRVRPTLEVPRMGRFARMAQSSLLISSDSHDPDNSEEVGGADQEHHPPVCYNVDIVSLVTVRSWQKKGRACEGMSQEGVGNGRLRNFKRFHKVQNAGGGVIPRFPSLAVYVPPTTTSLNDWTVVEQERNEGNDELDRGNDSDNSQNIFDLSARRRSSVK